MNTSAATLPLPALLAGRGIKPLSSLLAHSGLALAAFLLTLLAGLPMAWIKGKAHYLAEASIQIAPRYMRNLREDQELDFQSNSQYRQFVEHQRQSIGRHDVLRDALLRVDEQQRKLWQGPKDSERAAVEKLRKQLQVSAVSDTYLIRLSLEGEQPAGLAEMVNAVAATFIERMKSEEIYGADERSRQLRAREKELVESISNKVDQRGEIARELSLTTFAEGTPNPYDQLVASLRNKLSDARQRRMDADAALNAFTQRGDTTLAARSVQEAVLSDPGLNGLKSALSARRATLLVQKSGLRADHPGAVAAERELAEIELELQGQGGRLDRGVRLNMQARLQGTAEQAAAVEQGLRAELSELEPQATRFAKLFQDAQTLSSDIGQMREELNKVRERINFLSIESNSFGFLRLVTPALLPELPFGPGRKKLFLMVLLAACAAGLMAPVLRDMLDRRVRTVNDAQRLMGMAPAGWQVQREGLASQVFADEQLRRLAAALIRNRERGEGSAKQGAQGVFGLTGCKPGAGTSSLVLELANTLRTLGFKVLTVEANGFSRDARFASGRPGLQELLRDEAKGGQVIAPASADLPPRVSVGGQGRIALERLDKLGAQLRHWSEIADFVLVDMPPLLVSADAELLVRSVGQVLLVIEAGAVTTGEVQRARRLLQTLDPQAVGWVVNRVEAFTGGGYLHDLMIESVTGRRADTFFSTPQWRLTLQAWWLGTRNNMKARSSV
ncbi:GumC family protein [Roseateles albus]|uniref:Polysaccharide chain length determinant N-terminal domain-containing protein n=1 Tax=Roseateles albus TaxID=2987525 RepID=A0ABT5KHR7_9BURK|nr:hypothetical protein [Roseateles albus]MDC8772994.1 hypothetical protein [Roseateles albus]